MTVIRILKPSIDDIVIEGNPCLRGIVSNDTISNLRIDHAYQREFLSSSTRRYIMNALSGNQRLPDIEAGMRGLTWSGDTDHSVILHDPVFIIDGQQRRGSVLEFLARFPDRDPRLGIIVHFGSTVEWERERFHALNLHQTRVSGAIILRNMRTTCPGVATVYGLTVADTKFPLYDRVGWNQTLLAKDLISASTYVRSIQNLHGHIGSGVGSVGLRHTLLAFDKLEQIIGLSALRENVKKFWATIDDCWGVRDLTYRGATWLKTNFLDALSGVFDAHTDFWDGGKFIVPVEIRNRLEKFPVADPEIKLLAASSGIARVTLTFHLITHLNHGRRNLLHKRDLETLHRENRATALKKNKEAIRAGAVH